ncbi:unnamed protein product [Toxocara canis]|nr:unnamed protein product [Toxocara canis]
MYPSMNMADGRRWPRDTLRGTTTKLEKNIVQSSPNSASSDDIEEVVILPSETTVPLEESSSKDTEKKVEVASEMEKKEGDESPKIAQEPGKEKEAVVNGLVRVIGQMSNTFIRSNRFIDIPLSLIKALSLALNQIKRLYVFHLA